MQAGQRCVWRRTGSRRCTGEVITPPPLATSGGFADRDRPLRDRVGGRELHSLHCEAGGDVLYVSEIALTGRAPGKYNLYLGGSLGGTRLNQLAHENIGEARILEILERNSAASRRSAVPASGLEILSRRGRPHGDRLAASHHQISNCPKRFPWAAEIRALKEGGAACRTRTCDPIITNDVLYQLS